MQFYAIHANSWLTQNRKCLSCVAAGYYWILKGINLLGFFSIYAGDVFTVTSFHGTARHVVFQLSVVAPSGFGSFAYIFRFFSSILYSLVRLKRFFFKLNSNQSIFGNLRSKKWKKCAFLHSIARKLSILSS